MQVHGGMQGDCPAVNSCHSVQGKQVQGYANQAMHSSGRFYPRMVIAEASFRAS